MTLPALCSRITELTTIGRISLYAPTRIILYCAFCLFSLAALLLVVGDAVTPFVVLWYLALLTVALPVFFVSDPIHPLIVYLYWQILFLTDFWVQYSFGMRLRFAPQLGLEKVHYFLSYSLCIYIVWYVSLLLGFRLGVGLPLGKASVFPLSMRIRQPWIAAGAAIAVAVLAFVAAMQVGGGSIEAMIHAMGRRRVTYEGFGFLKSATAVGAIAALILLYRRMVAASLVVLAVTMVGLALFGGRGAVIVGVLMPYFMAYYYRQRRVQLVWILAAALATIGFVVGWGTLRTTGEWQADPTDVVGLFVHTAQQPDQADNVAAMVWGLHSGQIPYQYGQTILNSVLSLIPRGLWPDKPETSAGATLGLYFTGKEAGRPPGPYGLAYLNFGWPGVVAMGFLTGLVVCLYYRWFSLRVSRGRWDRVGVVLYPLVILGLFAVFDGGAQRTIASLTVAAVALAVLSGLRERFRRRRSSRPGSDGMRRYGGDSRREHGRHHRTHSRQSGQLPSKPSAVGRIG